MTLNKVMLIGRLGQDPETKTTGSGVCICNFSLATSEKYTDKSGVKQEKTEWHKVVTFGRTAELAAQYLRKGREVYVEGKVQTEEWQDKEGNKRYTTKINASTLQFLGSKGDSGGAYDPGAAERSAPPVGSFDQSFDDSDIPF